MTTCPACQRDVQADLLECPYCGVVFAKWKDRLPSPVPAPVPRPTMDLQPLINRLALALFIVIVSWALYSAIKTTGVGDLIGTIEATVGLRNKAPDFQLTTLEGESFNKESLKGQPTLVIFWSPWCGVCKRELPILAQFYRLGKPSKLRVLAVGFLDTQDNVIQYVNNNPETFVFPTAFTNQRSNSLGFSGTPTYILLDTQGHLLIKYPGAGILDDPEFQQFLASLKTS